VGNHLDRIERLKQRAQTVTQKDDYKDANRFALHYDEMMALPDTLPADATEAQREVFRTLVMMLLTFEVEGPFLEKMARFNDSEIRKMANEQKEFLEREKKPVFQTRIVRLGPSPQVRTTRLWVWRRHPQKPLLGLSRKRQPTPPEPKQPAVCQPR
jgi:hypothetical protein